MPIFDQGYQHWNGQLAGHTWRWLTVTRHGVRAQMKNRVVRILLLLAWLPAIALVAALALWGMLEQKSASILGLFGPMLPEYLIADPRAYRSAVWTICYSFFFRIEMWFIMLLVCVVGPGLVSRDLRYNALPLYFSRPLRRVDYFLGKLGVIGALVAAIAVAPAALAYVLGVCFSLDLTVLRDTYMLLPASVVYGALIAVSAGLLMLAFSSLSRRSIYVGIAWFGLWLISGSVAFMLMGIQQSSLVQRAWEQEVAVAKAANANAAKPIPAKKLRKRMQQQDMAGFHAGLADKLEKAQADAARSDWRPLFSYTDNLYRLGELLLRTDAAWVEVGRGYEAQQRALGGGFGLPGIFGPSPPPANERRFADMLTPQYPWTWSAMVLAGLIAVSLWILTFRVKSLDRLK